MEGHMRDVCVLEEEVVYDQSQFGLLNSQIDDSSVSPALLNDPPRSNKPVNKWGKLARTAALCGAYISLGLCMSVTGPTLLYLKDQVGSTISEISYIFTVRSIGTLGGAFLGSILLDRCNPYSAFFVVIAMMAISVGSMPWCKHIWMLMASSFVVGMGNGLLDTGASTLCLQLWGKDSGPYMQALHFSFAVGGSIAPLLVQAFIVETTARNNTMSSRHVRSVTHPLNVSELEDEMTTVESIIKAISEPPVLKSNLSSNSTTPTLNPNNAMNNSAPETTSTTTPDPTVSQNQTTLAVDKPKKPKPAVINGQILGPSSQYDNVPLKIETPPPEEIVVATTTTASNESQTTTTTTPSNVVAVSNDTAVAQNSSVIEKPTMILKQLNETEELNGNRSLSNTTTGSLESELKITGNVTTLSMTIPNTSTAASTVTDAPPSTVTTVTIASKSTGAGESQHDELLFGNITIDAGETTFPATTITSPTTRISITSTTSLPTALLSSSTETTSSFLTVVQSIPIENVTLPIPVVTILPVDPAEPSIVKSRGKYRGQQDGVSLAVPSSQVVTNEPDGIITSTTTTPAVSEGTVIIDRAPTKVADYLERFGVTRMHMLYTVIAIIVLHTAFFFLFFLCSGTRSSTAERQTSDRRIKALRPVAKRSFVVLMFSFYLMYVGSEVVFAQFLTTFALESPLKLATSTANYITTTFWASFAAARFVAIFVAHFTNPTIMLIFNLCCTAMGSMTLCIAGQTDVSILYVGSALVGIGMASTFATGFLWTETHLLVTNRISAAFSIASSMGEMIFPTVTGAFIESKPMSLMYIVLGCTLLMTAIFFVAWHLTKGKGRGFHKSSKGYQLARQAEDESLQN
ncbi:uncharacterized protein LOC130688697 [Daphnia carinata]|uniref:uncharacterized protein LOC130688697 n=1 Tax=Daphnia carinata TaxID=120202 RepID=UPI00257E9A9B|nr:uncharacterized protein LOC130688697 [Daphnia carinata]